MTWLSSGQILPRVHRAWWKQLREPGPLPQAGREPPPPYSKHHRGGQGAAPPGRGHPITESRNTYSSSNNQGEKQFGFPAKSSQMQKKKYMETVEILFWL